MSARKGKGADSSEGGEAVRTKAKSSTPQDLNQELQAGKRVLPIVRPSVFERDLDYLLNHAEDHDSREKEEKRAWLEAYERFRSQAPQVMVGRLEGILPDKDWIRLERPLEIAQQYVIYGIDFAREVLRPEGEHETWSKEVLKLVKALDYEKAKASLAQVVRFPRPSDYDAFLLSVAQTYILDRLDKVWYIAFVGSMSSGKTTATKVWAYLADRTYHVATVSAAAIVAIMQKARGLTIDEVDATLKRGERDLVEALLRQGIERGQPYVKMMEVVQGGRRQHVLQGVPTFGPKAFNYRGKLEDALTSRADLVEMRRAKDPALRRRARRYREQLAPLKAWLEWEAEKALAGWSHERVHEYEASEEFVARSDALRVELDRTGEIGDLMLLVGKVMDWSVERVIQERLDTMAMAIEEPIVEEVQEEILKMVEQAEYKVGEEWRIPKAALRGQLDLARKDRGERSIWGNDLAAALRELGLTNEGRSGREDRRRCLILTAKDVERLKTSLGGGGTGGTGGIIPLSRWSDEGGPTSVPPRLLKGGIALPQVLDRPPDPSIPAIPPSPREEDTTRADGNRYYARALDRFREDPQREETWVEQDLMLAHQISEKDRPAVRETVHRAYLVSLRERTHLPAEGSSGLTAAVLRDDRARELETAAGSEESSVAQAEMPARKEEQVKRRLRSLAVLARLGSPERSLEEIAARIAEDMRKHGHVVDLEQVKAEAKDVIELAFGPRSQEGKSSSPSRLTSSDESREKGEDEGGPPS